MRDAEVARPRRRPRATRAWEKGNDKHQDMLDEQNRMVSFDSFDFKYLKDILLVKWRTVTKKCPPQVMQMDRT